MKYFIKYGLAFLIITSHLTGMEHSATIPVPTVEDFVQAVDNNDFEVISSCIEAAAWGYLDLNSHLDKVSKHLIVAAEKGYADIVRELLRIPGIDINAKYEDGTTALIWAAWKGRTEVVRELLQAPGIDVNAKDEEGTTALIWAASEGHTECVKQLP